MDQAMVNWAVTAMDFGDDTVRAEQWFKLLADAYQDPDESEPVGGWDEFVARLNLAADREGFDSAQVQYFVENLGNTASDPIGDVVVPMYEQQDALPQEYLNLRAAAGGGDQEAGSEESEWHWDDAQQVWHHLENNEWVPQLQNGLALNYERTEWVAAQSAAVADAGASADPEWRWDESRQVWDHLENDDWVPQVQNGYALNYEKTEWVPIEAAAPVEEAPPTETLEPTEEPEPVILSEEDQAALEAGWAEMAALEPEEVAPEELQEVEAELESLEQVETVFESVAPAIEEAIKEVDGIELGDLTEDQVDAIFERLLGTTSA